MTAMAGTAAGGGGVDGLPADRHTALAELTPIAQSHAQALRMTLSRPLQLEERPHS